MDKLSAPGLSAVNRSTVTEPDTDEHLPRISAAAYRILRRRDRRIQVESVAVVCECVMPRKVEMKVS
jgi:hypothetical protein